MAFTGLETKRLARIGHKPTAGNGDEPSSAGTTKWHVEIHNRTAPLEEPWRAIEAKGCCGLFQSFDWYSSWCEVALQHRLAEPIVVTAARGRGAEPEILLPLCRVRRRGYLEIGFPRVVTDFAGPVIASEALEEAGAFRRLWPQILRALPKCDLVHLRVLPERLGCFRNPLLELPGSVPFPSGLWGISLKDAADGQLASTINRDVLRKTNSRKRRMEEAHAREFEWHEHPEHLPQLFQELVELRRARSKALGRNEILNDHEWLDFYLGMATRAHGGIRPVITRLTADGTCVAVRLGFVYDGIFHEIIPGLAGREWNRYAPGIQLILETLKEAARRGITYYDLTIGDEEYKASLGAERRPLFQIVIPRSIRGWTLYIPWHLKFMITSRLGNQAELGP